VLRLIFQLASETTPEIETRHSTLARRVVIIACLSLGLYLDLDSLNQI
jgi:hypothetical protein